MKSGGRNIAIIGAGVAGLSAAYFLLKRGYKVSLYEREETLGGLAASFDFGGGFIEKYYHFICMGDSDLVDLCEELGLSQKIFWRPTRMSFFYDGKLYPFGTPLDLLFFRPVGPVGRLRFGFNIIYARSLKYWQALENEPAHEWLTRQIGRQAYDVIWKPLLKIKFGECAEEVSASWMWHRIHRVAKSRRKLLQREMLGYLVGGTQTLIDALSRRIREMGGTIHPSARVASVNLEAGAVTGIRTGGETVFSDRVVSTLALPLTCKLLPDGCANYRSKLERIKYIGAVCMILKLARPLTESFWVNINDPRISFNGIIEYTNLNPRPDFGGDKIAYIPYYLMTSNPRYAADSDALVDEYSAALRLVSKDFVRAEVRDYRVFRDPYAQAICTTNFSKLIPEQKTPIKGFYVLDSTQLYPSDRTISGMIGLAKTLAETMGRQ
jgi:protoporphyrinogen oxidase